jgi:signal transduction histidine kinase/ActR/RegA family two-component response regulator
MNAGAAKIAETREPLSALIVEDSEEDTDLLVLELRRGRFDPTFHRVDTAEAMASALAERRWDVVISDYSMPRFTVAEALRLVRETDPDIPFLIVSATIIDEQAIAAMRSGAHDFVMKDKLSRLAPAIRRELRESAIRRERKSLEEQLRQARKLESLGVIAGGVAHDFNNLLTGILGNASLVLEILNPPDPARRMLLDMIDASQRAADLTRQLLAYAGKGRYFVQATDLSERVHRITSLIRSSIPKTVELVLDLEKDPPRVEADPSQLEQLIMNLVINAGEAIGEKNGAVVVTTSVADIEGRANRDGFLGCELEPGRYVVLTVQDNGCGMDNMTKAHIFDPFFSTKFTGRGLGLAAALGIVRGHRGAIKVESAVGKGSTFTILFPAVSHASQVPCTMTTAPTELAGWGGILVVDDEDMVRRTATAALKRYGYQVFEAANGLDAVVLFEKHKDEISLVLLDLTMPVQGGEEAYQRLIDIRPDVPIILSSGYDELQACRCFADKPIAGFLQKPYTAETLGHKVKQVLASGRRQASAGCA